MPIGSHDDFLELCALAASGELTASENKKLSAHLAVCSSCREAQKQFESLVDGPISALAAEDHTDPHVTQDPSWSIETAEAELFERLADEQSEKGSEARSSRELRKAGALGHPSLISMDRTWRELWISYAAAILLVLSLGVAAYRVGMRHPVLTDKSVDASIARAAETNAFEKQISDLSRDRELADAEIARRDKLIAELKKQLQQQSAELVDLKTTESELKQEASVRKSGQDLSDRQAQLEQKLQQAELNVQSVRVQLEAVQQQSSQDSDRVATLQAKLDDLNGALQQKEGEIARQQELLAHDRDIRDLMGARDLYITEVYDVARSGETQKAFGRLFYTKEKSLIFYAYDLDREPGIKNAATFQAWGRRGPDRSQALNLGVFYEDNVAKRRWVLKYNDPTALAQIDAVFVTIEPNGGSRKPSGKPLLFAYLKMDPNHP